VNASSRSLKTELLEETVRSRVCGSSREEGREKESLWCEKLVKQAVFEPEVTE